MLIYCLLRKRVRSIPITENELLFARIIRVFMKFMIYFLLFPVKTETFSMKQKGSNFFYLNLSKRIVRE